MKTLLCVEDNQDDRLLLGYALKLAGIVCDLEFVRTAAEAQVYLANHSDRKHLPWPALVLTDLGLPGGSGLELLAWIRSQPSLADLPVMAMSGSENPALQRQALELGATDCALKTPGFEDVVKRVKLLLGAENEKA